MKTYVATVKEGGIQYNITVQAESRDKAVDKIPLRPTLVSIVEVK